MSFRSSTDARNPDLGTEVAGFRLERELGRGKHAVVYEATQISLDRRVALKLLPPREQGPSLASSHEWPEHPHVVSLYAVGTWEHGQFVAMRLVPGSSLARLAAEGELDPARSLELLTQVASALDAAHRAGVVHGAVGAGNVLVDRDGQAFLSDFGLASGESSVAADRRDFAALLRELLGERLPALSDPASRSAGQLARIARSATPAPPRNDSRARVRRRRVRLAAGSALGLAGAVALAVILIGGGAEEPDPVPSVMQGNLALGSGLGPGRVSSVDCSGRAPTGGSQACTLVQTQLPGRRLVPQEPGVIRRWAVRGASGQLALQVVRRVGDRYVSTGRTRFERVPDHGVHVLPANLPVRSGDRLGVQITPGAAIGVRRRVTGATTARWLGQLVLTARPIELGAKTGFDHEVLLRVEYAPGAKLTVRGTLSGRAAARAPAGRELSARNVEVPGGLRRVVVVKLADAIVVDLFAGERRIARVPAPDTNPAGRLLNFTTGAGPYPLLRWRNPNRRTVSHQYTVRARSLDFRG